MRELVVNVCEDNLPAIKLYEKFGFVIERREERLFTADGKARPSFFMKKTF